MKQNNAFKKQYFTNAEKNSYNFVQFVLFAFQNNFTQKFYNLLLRTPHLLLMMINFLFVKSEEENQKENQNFIALFVIYIRTHKVLFLYFRNTSFSPCCSALIKLGIVER